MNDHIDPSQPVLPVIPNRAIFETTCKIFFDNGWGTAFIINHERRQFIVSAKHLFEGVSLNQNIEFRILDNYQEKKLTGRFI